LVHEAKWISTIVIQDKKNSQEIKVCVDYTRLNNACVHNPFPTPFSNEVLYNVAGNEAYSFTDGFPSYHQIHIIDEDKKKTSFKTVWGSYDYNVMLFILKNVPVGFSRIVIVALSSNTTALHFDEIVSSLLSK